MSEIIQGSPEWHALRLGNATGSNFDACLAKGKGLAEATTRRNYRIRLALERITGKSHESGFKSTHMDTGTEREPFARMAYEGQTGAIVEEVPYIPHKFLRAGVSPDGLVGSDGMVEIKCPSPAVHWEYLQLDGQPPSEYRAQIMGQMWVTGRQWVDFVSYSPDFPDALQLRVTRVVRDEAYITTLENEVSRFLADVEATVREIDLLALARGAA